MGVPGVRWGRELLLRSHSSERQGLSSGQVLDAPHGVGWTHRFSHLSLTGGISALGQVWRPQNVFPGCTSARGPQVRSRRPSFTRVQDCPSYWKQRDAAFLQVSQHHLLLGVHTLGYICFCLTEKNGHRVVGGDRISVEHPLHWRVQLPVSARSRQ